MDIVWKAAVVWFGIACLAIANGVLREAVLKRRLEEPTAHVVSTLILAAVIIAVAFATRAWIGAASLGEAWQVSTGWLLATLAFEFLAGHYAFGNSWAKILADYDVRQGRVWLLIPSTVLFAEPIAYVGLPPKFLGTYLVSNLVAGTLLILAISMPKVARWVIVAIFLYAGIYNNWLGLMRPLEYQGFAELAVVPWYQDFIRGPLRESGGLLIPAIGLGQLLIAVGGALGGRLLVASMMGCCVFLLAIAPLGVGSACPFSFVVSLAAIVVASAGATR